MAEECLLEGSTGLAAHSDINLAGGHFVESDCRGNGFIDQGCYVTKNWYYYTRGTMVNADSVEDDPNLPGEPRYYLLLGL